MLKSLFFFLGLAMSVAAFGQCNISHPTTGDLPSSGSPNFLLGQPYDLTTPGTLTELGITTDEGVLGQVVLALYSDVGGAPGALLTQTASTTLVLGQNDIPVTPVELSAGTYWIMWLFDVGTNFEVTSAVSDAPTHYVDLSFGSTLPTSLTGSTISYSTFQFVMWMKTCVFGCTDASACNYDPLANEDDGSCTFPGCTTVSALNYDSTAGCDDGSCFYGGGCDIFQPTNGDSTTNGSPNFLLGQPYEIPSGGTVSSLGITTTEGSMGNAVLALYTDIGGQPGSLLTQTAPTALSIGQNDIPVSEVEVSAGTYWIMWLFDTLTDYEDFSGTLVPTHYVALSFGASLPGFLGGSTISYNTQHFTMWMKVCSVGCTVNTACNYDPNATFNDGSCVFPGCTVTAAVNYDPSAGCDDGSCSYDEGCQLFYPTSGDIMTDGSPNFLLGQPYDIPTGGTLTELGISVIEPAPGLGLLALYSDNAGEPGTLITQSAITELVLGQNHLPVTEVELAAGTYWVMWLFDMTIGFEMQSGTTVSTKYIALPFGDPLPATISPGSTSEYFTNQFTMWMQVCPNLACGDPLAVNYCPGESGTGGCFYTDACGFLSNPEESKAVGFSGDYAPGNWTQDAGAGNGTIQITPWQLSITGSDGTPGGIFTSALIEVTESGVYTFSYEYLTSDVGANFDPAYWYNGNWVVLENVAGVDYNTAQVSVYLDAGDQFGWAVFTTDGCCGAATLNVTNFVHPGTSPCTPGCTDQTACNYDVEATTENDSCEYDSCRGCTYVEATNYDGDAVFDDGSCDFSCQEDLDGSGNIGTGDLLALLGLFGTDCP